MKKKRHQPLAGLGARLYPELQSAEDHDKRQGLFKSAQRRLFRNVWAWIVALPGSAVLIAFLYYFKSLAARSPYFIPWVYDLICLGLILAYIFTASTFLFVKPMRRYIREELRARGVLVCMGCGYDLRGQVRPTCPECGRTCDEMVQSG